jgi:hypothetical protein|tara:strand:- start:807 stop:1472 length:666 start_codon:yes stop_codon:yes gene_type:complete
MQMYSKYFQKSKVFFYPLLGIPKGKKYVPVGTYLAWKDEIAINDKKFMLLYKQKSGKLFNKFEDKYLLGNPLFDDYQKLGEDIHLYIFDFTMYTQDWDMLINGKYSKFDDTMKQTITKFFGEVGKITEYVESYIYPEYYHKDIAEQLAVPMKLIEKVWELTDKPDIDKETLKLKIPKDGIFNNNDVPLQPNLKKESNGNKESNGSSDKQEHDGNNIKLGSK